MISLPGKQTNCDVTSQADRRNISSQIFTRQDVPPHSVPAFPTPSAEALLPEDVSSAQERIVYLQRTDPLSEISTVPACGSFTFARNPSFRQTQLLFTCFRHAWNVQ